MRDILVTQPDRHERRVPVGLARAKALLKDQQMVGSEPALGIALGSERDQRGHEEKAPGAGRSGQVQVVGTEPNVGGEMLEGALPSTAGHGRDEGPEVGNDILVAVHTHGELEPLEPTIDE